MFLLASIYFSACVRCDCRRNNAYKLVCCCCVIAFISLFPIVLTKYPGEFFFHLLIAYRSSFCPLFDWFIRPTRFILFLSPPILNLVYNAMREKRTKTDPHLFDVDTIVQLSNTHSFLVSLASNAATEHHALWFLSQLYAIMLFSLMHVHYSIFFYVINWSFTVFFMGYNNAIGFFPLALSSLFPYCTTDSLYSLVSI